MMILLQLLTKDNLISAVNTFEWSNAAQQSIKYVAVCGNDY